MGVVAIMVLHYFMFATCRFETLGTALARKGRKAVANKKKLLI